MNAVAEKSLVYTRSSPTHSKRGRSCSWWGEVPPEPEKPEALARERAKLRERPLDCS